MKFYEAAERISETVFKSMAYFVATAGVIFYISPLAALLLHYLKGTYSIEKRLMPYKIR